MIRGIIAVVCVLLFVVLCTINPHHFVLNFIISCLLAYVLDDIFYVPNPKEQEDDEGL